MRQRNRHDDQFVGVHAQSLSGRCKHPDHAQPAVTDPHQLPECRLAAKQLFANLGPDDCHRRTPVPVFFRQGLALRQLEITQRDEFCRRAGDHHFPQAATKRDFRGADSQRCHSPHAWQAAQTTRIINGQVTRGAGDGIGRVEAAGARAPWQNNHQIGTQR